MGVLGNWKVNPTPLSNHDMDSNDQLVVSGSGIYITNKSKPWCECTINNSNSETVYKPKNTTPPPNRQYQIEVVSGQLRCSWNGGMTPVVVWTAQENNGATDPDKKRKKDKDNGQEKRA